MPTRDVCHECGRPAADHHAFVPVVAPEGCVCEPLEWGDPTNIPPICEAVMLDEEYPSVCRRCEHDYACHRRTDGD